MDSLNKELSVFFSFTFLCRRVLEPFLFGVAIIYVIKGDCRSAIGPIVADHRQSVVFVRVCDCLLMRWYARSA